MEKARRPRIPHNVVAYSILPCLPAKVLMRLQLVSKSWRSLILNDPYFARLQAARAARSSPSLLLITEKSEPNLYAAHSDLVGFPKLSEQFDREWHWRRPKIIASCKGIVCVSVVSRNWQRELLYVGNPVLNNWILLPLPYDCFRNVAIGLAVNETESGVGYKLAAPSFGFDSDESAMEVGFKVLASTKGSWEISKERVLTNNRQYRLIRYVTNVEGTLFWEHCDKAIWFDAKEERCGTFLLPWQFKYCRLV